MQYKLCLECSDRNQQRIAAFHKHNPGASVEHWEKFFEKNDIWQVKRQLEHCPQEEI